MDGWFEVTGVPIMDEHVRPLRDGKQLVMDRRMLDAMAKANQDRYLDTGDEAAVVADFEFRRGHTRRDSKSTLPNPEVVGFAKNFRVVDGFGKLKPRAALVCDMRFEEKDRERLKKFPRRSVEWFPSDNIIDPIALLGAEAPVRSLGLMQFSRDDERLLYSMDELNQDAGGIPNLDAIVQAVTPAVMNAFANSPMGQYIAGKMQEEQPQEPAVPEPAPDVQPEPSAPQEEPEQMSRTKSDIELDDMKVRFSRVESELATQKKRADEAERRFRRADRERVLIQLASEGYKFSRNEELDYVVDMEDAKFKGHVERIRKNYSKAPVTPLPVMYGRNGEELADGGDERMDNAVQFSRDDIDKAQSMMRTDRISFEQACERILAAKAK